MILDSNLKTIIKDWKRKKVFLLTELVEIFNCSEITVKCYLRKWGAISSYNMNSRYYTLPEIAEFDSNGLWHYDGIGFSENGNLVQTIVHLVSSSKSGLYVRDISDILQLDCTSLISRIFKRKKIIRENMSGKYVYFSTDKDNFEQQFKERKMMIETQTGAEISDSIAVVILKELIDNPDLTDNEFIKYLCKKKVHITVVQLHSFLEYHGIKKKLRSCSSNCSS